MGEFLAIIGLIFYSVNIIITKIAAARLNIHVGFLISVGLNVLFGTLLLLVSLFFFEEIHLDWNTKGFFLFLSAGFFSTYLGRWFFVDTIDKLGPTRASAFMVSNPLFTTIIAWIFLGERLIWLDLLSVFLMLFGLFLVSNMNQSYAKKEIAAGSELSRVKSSFSFHNLLHSGIIVAFLSSLSYSVGNVVRGAAIQSWNQPIIGGILGAVLGLVLHVITNKNTLEFFGKLKTFDRKGVILYSISGVITMSAQILSIASMRYMPVSISNLITMSTPVIVAPVSFFLFKNQETITIRTIAGIILVLAGISAILLL
ncbi:hypothetical protein CVD28_05470 [Bacillus sp. M6-12]|uniref:DMT family transporter n=1 Tax=Bacillus sp. M6-12 TaxID=2054166 RepID=UPI000C7641D1|nr:DMT family transporter [Bacillus sp. M6-12]PLS18589.1 hypothetical protein CVD28_05470 [Bacillus sp. M6-12]